MCGNRVAALYSGYDATVHHTMRGGKIPRFHLKSLPPPSAVPALDAMFNSEKDKIPDGQLLANVEQKDATTFRRVAHEVHEPARAKRAGS